MALLQQLLDRLSGASARAAGESAHSAHRLARVARQPAPAPSRPPLQQAIEALEGECAQPLYDRSVYVSTPQDPAA